MSRTDSASKRALRHAPTSSLSPVLFLLGKLKGQMSEKENQQLLDDLVAFMPRTVRRVPCAGRESASAKSMTPQTEASPFAAMAERPEPDLEEWPSAFSGDAENVLTELQERFAALQEYYPLRAASLYLRFLCRIWVGLVEEKKLELMADDDFIRLYLDAMLKVEAIALRCESCPLTEDVGLQ